MIAQVEPIVFTVEEAAKLAHCDAYSLLSLAVDKGVHIYTYLPENSLVVSLDRRYVRGEGKWDISENSPGLSFPTSVPCMTGLRLDDSDCLEIVRQKKFSRAYFEWGVLITGKDLPVESHASDTNLIGICSPPRGDEWTKTTGTPLWDEIAPFPGQVQPYESPQRYFGAYPSEIRETLSSLAGWMPRPREVVLHPDNLFLLKEGLEQLGLMDAKGSGQAVEDALRKASEPNVCADSLASASVAELSGRHGVEGAEEGQADRVADSAAEEVVIAQLSDIQIQDYWSFWLKELIEVARQRWSNRGKDHGVLGDEERMEIAKDILLRNRDHEGRKLKLDELSECVTLITPVWARHWKSPNLREMTSHSPVTDELQKMIEVAERIQEFKVERTGRLTKVRVVDWLQTGKGLLFSGKKSDLVARLLLDFPKKINKAATKKLK